MLKFLKNVVFRRLQAERDADWIACLDFGTAFSKMAMVLGEDREDLEKEDIRPLPIGDQGGPHGAFLLPSSVYVKDDSLVFGVAAQQAALRGAQAGRCALEAPKQYLSTTDLAVLDEKLPVDIDPTGRYTPRQLITFYLAFLLMRAETEARATGLPWPPRLRIARPAWRSARASDGEAILKSMVREAFFLSDMLEERLLDRDGLTHAAAQEALDVLSRTDLSRTEWDARVFALSQKGDASVLEATAVAAGSIRPEGRRVVVVADIGGGTSDFAAFMTGLPGRNVVAELSNSNAVLRNAGDHIDMLLRKFILDRAGYLEDDPAARGPLMRLRLRQRSLKEDLFEQGRIAVELVDAFVEVTVDEFLAYPPVRNFSARLRDSFDQALDSAINVARNYVPSSRLPVEILLTGGGYNLPMVRALANDPRRDWIFLEASPDLAGLSDDPDFTRVARQLAVAIGGAVRDLPVQTAPVRIAKAS